MPCFGGVVGIKEYLKKLPLWIQLVVAGLLFICGQIVSAIIQTGSPPNWLVDLVSWISLKISSVANAFIAKTLPLWTLFTLVCLVGISAGYYIRFIGGKYRDVKSQFDALKQSNNELVQDYKVLEVAKGTIATQLAELRKAHSELSDSLASVKSERDSALREVKRANGSGTSLATNFAHALRYDQSPFSNNVEKFFPKSFKVLSSRENQERSCAEVLENVMLCTIKDSAATFDDVQRLTSMPRLELESCLDLLSANNYVQVTRYGASRRYQLTPRARKHFVCKENNIKTELSFI